MRRRASTLSGIEARIRRQLSGKQLAGHPLIDRKNEIARIVQNWNPRGGQTSVLAFEIFESRDILPFSGAWLEQPEWVIDDFTHFWLLREWHELDLELANPTELPPLDMLL